MCLEAKDINFYYRYSSFADTESIILSATLRLETRDTNEIRKRVNFYRQKRLATQPVGYPSLGSVFKRPSKNISAAQLIDECDLKGKRIGGAEISTKHAGFIINSGYATAQDYLSLAEFACNTVYERFAIRLEKEIEII